MSVYIVESTKQDFSWPDDSELKVAWIAGMPKRINAAHGLEIAFILKHHIESFNARAASPVKIVSDKEDAWYSRQFAVEATPEAATALAAIPEIKVTPYDGKHIRSSYDGFR